MGISVIILTCNQKRLTSRCLKSIYGLTDRDDCEVILVDNGSMDGTADTIARQFPKVIIQRQERNLGVAAGRNRGLQIARHSHLMILDNDTICDPATVVALADYLDTHGDVGLVGPRLVNPQGETQTSFRPYPGIFAKIRNIISGKRKSSITTVIPPAETEPFYLIGAAQMFRREIYEQAGGLDEKIFYGPEDADFCMSVRQQGYRVVYLPWLTIIHDWQRATTSRLLSQGALTHLKALLYFYRKHRRWF